MPMPPEMIAKMAKKAAPRGRKKKDAKTKGYKAK